MERLVAFKNPLTCDMDELTHVIEGLEGIRYYPEHYKPAELTVADYQFVKEILSSVNQKSAEKYKTLGEYLLSLVPDREIRKKLESLLA